MSTAEETVISLSKARVCTLNRLLSKEVERHSLTQKVKVVLLS